MIWILPLVVLLFAGCQQAPQERHYTEIVTQAPEMPMMPADPHAGLDMSAMQGEVEMPTAMNLEYSWIAPEGWKQVPGSGMRLASFHLAKDKDAIDVSVISLSGMAGGIEANLVRWMGQIGMDSSNVGAMVQSAADIKTKGGNSGKIYDFTSNASEKSMIVAMLNVHEATLFVKMTGNIDAVRANKEDFLKLVKSIQHKDTP